MLKAADVGALADLEPFVRNANKMMLIVTLGLVRFTEAHGRDVLLNHKTKSPNHHQGARFPIVESITKKGEQ